MLTSKSITKNTKKDSQIFIDVKNLYHTAFPKQEQAPLNFLINLTKKETINLTAYYDNDRFVGLTYTMTHNSITYLWYLATSVDARSQGYGSKILAHFRESYPKNRLVLNLDIQDDGARDAEIRKKRKAFYLKNEYKPADYGSVFNKNHLDVMTLGGAVAEEEYLAIFKHNFGPIMSKLLKPKITH